LGGGEEENGKENKRKKSVTREIFTIKLPFFLFTFSSLFKSVFYLNEFGKQTKMCQGMENFY
jgi:hypothetical protein